LSDYSSDQMAGCAGCSRGCRCENRAACMIDNKHEFTFDTAKSA
jgi:hypothetical protein